MRLLLLLPLLLVGCAIPKGDIVSMTQSVIGIRIGQNPKTQTPEVQIGFYRSTFQFVPTSTNALYAPKVNSSLSLEQHGLNTTVLEDFDTSDAPRVTTNSVARIRAAVIRSPKEKAK